MSTFNISNFMSRFDGGARPTLFELEINPGITGLSVLNGANTKVFCKATTLPASTLGTIPVNFMGRVVNIPGDRTYEDWTITVLNDEKMELRRYFETWNSHFNQHGSNKANVDAKTYLSQIANSTVLVKQLNRNHGISRTYQLENIWCENVQATDLSYDTLDTISEFQVTFKYHGLTISSGAATASSAGNGTLDLGGATVEGASGSNKPVG